MPTPERWKKAPGEFQFYEVSNTGRIRNTLTGRELKIHTTNRQNRINLAGNKGPAGYAVGRLVAELYLKDWDWRKKLYRRDGNPTNDHIDNLYQK